MNRPAALPARVPPPPREAPGDGSPSAPALAPAGIPRLSPPGLPSPLTPGGARLPRRPVPRPPRQERMPFPHTHAHTPDARLPAEGGGEPRSRAGRSGGGRSSPPARRGRGSGAPQRRRHQVSGTASRRPGRSGAAPRLPELSPPLPSLSPSLRLSPSRRGQSRSQGGNCRDGLNNGVRAGRPRPARPGAAASRDLSPAGFVGPPPAPGAAPVRGVGWGRTKNTNPGALDERGRGAPRPPEERRGAGQTPPTAASGRAPARLRPGSRFTGSLKGRWAGGGCRSPAMRDRRRRSGVFSLTHVHPGPRPQPPRTCRRGCGEGGGGARRALPPSPAWGRLSAGQVAGGRLSAEKLGVKPGSVKPLASGVIRETPVGPEEGGERRGCCSVL